MMMDHESQTTAISIRIPYSVNDGMNAVSTIPAGNRTSLPLPGPKCPVLTNVSAAVEMTQYGPAYFF
jgi:hypothetical protein